MKILMPIAAAAFLVGCATEVAKTPLPIGGSKADGSIEMGYQYSPQVEIPKVDWPAATKLAEQRCNAWGYRNASPFQGVRNICETRDGYGNCHQYTVTKTFQCLN